MRRLDADGATDTQAAADLAGLVIKYSIWTSEARIMLRATGETGMRAWQQAQMMRVHTSKTSHSTVAQYAIPEACW